MESQTKLSPNALSADGMRKEHVDATLLLQAQKIKDLIELNEILGADKHDMEVRFNQLLQLLGTTHGQEELRITELKEWEALGKTSLGPNIPHAKNHLTILLGYARELASPGHRIIRFLDNTLGRTFFGRTVKRLLAFVLALRQA